MGISDLEQRLRLYLAKHDRAMEKVLGMGSDGVVWQTDKTTAVKVCEHLERYQTERDCYRLLMDKEITEICGFAVPRLINYDNALWVIEMDIVKPPYILDFGKAYLHRPPPELSEETMAEWQAQKQELYGEHWPTIRSILSRLRSMGIYHMDPRPHNILPANWNPEL
jgi:hypothetical protein